MELKNALGICVISFFSATLVMLIARSLDNQSTGRIEQQLTRIADQLETINASGIGASGSSLAMPVENQSGSTPSDELVVYYFFSSTRCITCRAIEEQTQQALLKNFGEQIRAGDVVWRTLNYEDQANAEWSERFEIMMPVVVLTQYKGGELTNWKRLDEVWGLVSDETAFEQLIIENVEQMLVENEDEDVNVSDATGTIPLPDSDTSAMPKG